jgi:adenylate kinase
VTEFIYIELSPTVVLERQHSDAHRVRSYSLETLTAWIEYEKQALISVCLETGLNLHFLRDASLQVGKQFIVDIINA